MRHVVGGRATLADKHAASTSEVGRFETETLSTKSNLTALMDFSGEWIAKAQGTRTGLRYDPDMGREAPLRFTASGQAWLASLDDEAALALLARQTDVDPADFGPNAPRTDQELLDRLAEARQRGYTCCVDSSALGTSAFGAVIRHPVKGHTIGVISVAGPSVRLTEQRMHELAPRLLDAVEELSQCSQASQLFPE